MYHSDCPFNSSDFNMPESRGNAVNVKRKKNNIQKKLNQSPLCLYGSFGKFSKNAFTGKLYVNTCNLIKEQTETRHYVDKSLPLIFIYL